MTYRWMLNFLRLLLRDTGGAFSSVIRYMSGIKALKLLLVTFFTAQVFYFSNKFLVYFDFTFSWRDLFSLVYVFGLFPFLFTYEKFLSGTFFNEAYEFSDGKVLDKAKEKFAYYGKPKRAWLVYLLSQASALIDVVIFTAIFALVMFVSKFDYASAVSWAWMGVYLAVTSILFVVAVFLWNRTFQIFRFWDRVDNLGQAWTGSRIFTTSQPRRFITLHTFIKFIQFLIPALIFIFVYKYAGQLLVLTQKSFTQTASVYVVMAAMVLIAFFAYQVSVAFSNVYNSRLAHYFEFGILDSTYRTSYMKPVSQLRKLLLINRLLILLLIIGFSVFVYLQVVNSRTITENVETRYPNVVKLYSDNFNSTTTIDAYMTPRYANGIAIAVYAKDGELYAHPLVAQIKNSFVPTSISAADIVFFNLSQPLAPPQLQIPFKDAVEYSNARKFALFVYINNEETANLVSSTTIAQPHLTVFFTDNLELSKNLRDKMSGYRVGALVKIIDSQDYDFQSVFIFNKDANNKLIKSLYDKNIKTYLLLQAGEVPDPSLDLSLVQGVLTDLPQLSYTEVRSISEEDVLKKVILSPLKLFGF